MAGLLELPEFLERQSKSSSGVMSIICLITLGIGLLMMYGSTIEIPIKDKVSYGIGGAIVILSIFLLWLLYRILYLNEGKLQFQKIYSNGVQTTVDQLDLWIKLMEYNEKAIAYNEKNETPKMDILNLNDLTDMVTKAIPD
jgi:hypothetical protein